MLTYADVCVLSAKPLHSWRLLTYADVCWRTLTYVSSVQNRYIVVDYTGHMLLHVSSYSDADVCWRMLTYADVCWRMLLHVSSYFNDTGGHTRPLLTPFLLYSFTPVLLYYFTTLRSHAVVDNLLTPLLLYVFTTLLRSELPVRSGRRQRRAPAYCGGRSQVRPLAYACGQVSLCTFMNLWIRFN
jgi:hypothetical protein